MQTRPPVPTDPTESPEFHRDLQFGLASAFATLFDAHYPNLVRYLIRYVSRDTAEDLAQDTVVRVWERRAEVKPQRSLRAYLLTAARNRALMYLEHEGVVSRYAQRSVGSLQERHAPPADADLLAWEMAQQAERILATLPERQREIWDLNRHEGLSPKEIAEVLGIAPATVYVQLARTVQALYPALHDWLHEPE